MEPLNPDDPEAQSKDIIAENISQLEALFPEAFTEGKVDFDVLKQLLGGVVDEREEKYGLNWHGKRRARQLALTPSTGTLRPCPEDSVDWDTTQNLMIEGDNLEVLKLLQKSYAGKVKLIYIDPPYNTGKDFVYPDNFQDNIKNYLELTGQVEGGARTSSNTETSGRFHTDWLNMMYPRLKLGRMLLRDDGVIAISVDDGELPRLTLLVEEVFGQENLVNVVAIKSSETSGVKMTHVEKRLPKLKEYVVIAARRRELVSFAPIALPKGSDGARDLDGYLKYYSKVVTNPDAPCTHWVIRSVKEVMLDSGLDTSDPAVVRQFKIDNAARVVYRTNNALLAGLSFETEVAEVVSPTGIKYVWWEGKQMLFLSEYLNETLGDLWVDISTINLNKETRGVVGFGEGQKPVSLIRRLLQLVTTTNDELPLVLDFFAGSGTTGDAVLTQNDADAGNRRYILVQLPEPLDPSNKDQTEAAEFCDSLGKPRNIAELTKERLRRASREGADSGPSAPSDRGFRVLKLDSTNIRAWDPDRDDLPATLDEAVQHLKGDRTEADILYELLLKLGLDLRVPIEKKVVDGKDVHSIGAGVLLVCLAESVAREEVEPLAQGIVAWHTELAPAGDTICVFRDSAFADDVAKTNLAAILGQYGLTTVRSL